MKQMTKKSKLGTKSVQKKSLESQLDKMYKQLPCGQFKIFIPLKDIEEILYKQQINVQQQEQVNQFAEWTKYKNALLEEVDQLWRYKDEEIVEQQGDEQVGQVKSYEDMLKDIYKKLEIKQSQVQKQITQPKLIKVGKAKFLIENYKEICEEFNRKPLEINEMLTKYLGTNVILQEDGQLLIKAAVTQGQVADALERYANTYVKCDSCGSFNTMIIKSEDGKNFTLSCEQCKCIKHINK